MVANEMRRDSPNLRQNDNFAVELDTFHDRRNGFLFYVTPVGGMFDGLTTDERTNNADWNTVWEAKAGRFDGGWIAEIAIPFKSLRYRRAASRSGASTCAAPSARRTNTPTSRRSSRSGASAAIFRVSAAATLVGLEAPPPGKNLEIKPYAISRLTTDTLARRR